MATKGKETFPDTLAEFGYKFKDMKLTNIKDPDKGFQFVVKEDDHSYNQKHYEALGEVISEEIYTLLETDCNLKRRPVPVDAKEGEPQTFIFTSDDALDNPDKLLVFIHGSGVVRAGQWARRLIINDSLESGTQIPFIQKAQKEGYGILVMNTNDNSRKVDGKTVNIKKSSNPESHAMYVWNKYVRKAKAKHIALIAHSYGGCVTTALFEEEKKDFVKRVFAVAMTDSVHYISKPKKFEKLRKMSCNWVSSLRELDTVLQDDEYDIKRVSSGVNVHEQTSWSSFKSVFRFLQERYDGASTTKTKGESEGDETESSQEELTLDRSMSIEESSPAEGAAVATKPVPPGTHDMSDSDNEGTPEETKTEDVEMKDESKSRDLSKGDGNEGHKSKKEKLGD